MKSNIGSPKPGSVLAALSVALVAALGLAACEGGLVVPDEETPGAIAGTITYAHGIDGWPPDSMLFDLRFVAMRFIPEDTADFLQLNRLEISNRLRTRVARDSFLIDDVAPGVFPYSGVAYRYSEDIFDWKPVGLYEEDGGVMTVRTGETTRVSVVVDFENPPIFPPK